MQRVFILGKYMLLFKINNAPASLRPIKKLRWESVGMVSL